MPDCSPLPRSLPYAERAVLPHVLGDGIWRSNHALILVRPGEAHDVRLLWSEEEWAFRGWYVNLQDPIRRLPLGFDTADHVADIVVQPNGEWSWKDENELAAALEVGRFDAGEVVAIREEGARVIADIESRRWPFDGSYIDWRPNPVWPVPAVPANWNDWRES